MKLGISRTDITPPLGLYLAGYGDRKGGCSSVADRLSATAAVFEDGGSRAALVSLDILGINEQICERIKKKIERRIKLNGLYVSCIHTHSGPVGWAPENPGPLWFLKECFFRITALPAGLRQPRGIFAASAYLNRLIETVADLIEEAAASASGVDVYYGTAPLKIGVNRRERSPDGGIVIGRNEEGPAPETVSVVSFKNKESGRPVLDIVNYDCHPVFFGPESYAVSADWVGRMREELEAARGCPALYLQGGCGNINPVMMDHGGDSAALAGAAGTEAAGAAAEAAAGAVRIAGDGLFAGSSVIDIPVADGEGYRKALSKSAGMPGWIVDPVLHFRYPWRTALKQDGRPATPLNLGILRLGDLSIAFLSMETFFETAETVRSLLPGKGLFAAYTNGLTGYLPTASACDEGGYEVDMSPYMYRLPGRLGRDAEAMVVDGFRELAAGSELQRPADIRDMRTDDEPEVQEICRRTFTPCPDFPHPEIISYRWASWYVRNSPDYCFAAVDEDDRAVGYILCAPDTREYERSYKEQMVPLIKNRLSVLEKTHPELYKRFRFSFLPPASEYSLPVLRKVILNYPAHLHIDILPGWQRYGFGGRLMRSLLMRLKQRGVPGVHLLVGIDNDNAVGFYKHFGFEIIATRKVGSGGFHAMGLKISEADI